MKLSKAKKKKMVKLVEANMELLMGYMTKQSMKIVLESPEFKGLNDTALGRALLLLALVIKETGTKGLFNLEDVPFFRTYVCRVCGMEQYTAVCWRCGAFTHWQKKEN